MITTVAVGTDGSETATAALEFGAELARKFGAELVLLGAFDEFKKSRRPEDPIGVYSYDPEAELRETLSTAQAELRGKGIECRTVVEAGEPAEVLVRAAEECEADVLVVGNRGMHRRVLGSIPNTVSHRAPCSVLVVKTT